ncbi:MAG: nucleotidyltransferase domain-containing protein [Thermodesulfovibrionales bacterium]
MVLLKVLSLNERRPDIISSLTESLKKEDDVIFAYLYGSFAEGSPIARDIDIAVYSGGVDDPFLLQANLKIMLSDALRRDNIDISPDDIDVRIINDAPYDFVIEILDKGILLVDKDPGLRTDFIERISLLYRINEIVLQEFYR